MAVCRKSILKPVLASVCFALALGVGAAGGQSLNHPADPPVDATELTLPQARQLALAALKNGQAGLAHQLALGLLQADGKSFLAHMILARAKGMLGRPGQGQSSAARAYRIAGTSLQRFEAAELSARLSYSANRPTRTQLWLRRAIQNAPNAQVETQLGQDYGRVRAENPLSFSIRGGVMPSSNVNNGADTALQIIDGLPFTGTLSGSAQALGGTVGTLDTALGYRLHASKTSETRLSARMFITRVALNDAARIKAPAASNDDFGSTYAEIGLTHRFATGTKGGVAELGGTLGKYWSGGSGYYSFARLAAGHDWIRAGQGRISVDGWIEQRFSEIAPVLDSRAAGLAVGWTHQLPQGDQVAVSLNLRQTDSAHANSRSRAAAVRFAYSLGQQIGPAKISAGIVAGIADYPDYTVIFAVPGGRQDKSLHADVSFFFPDIDYAGFAPTLRLRAGRSFSNVSRFETREMSMSLGIQSKF